jgi:hypothetical protein
MGHRTWLRKKYKRSSRQDPLFENGTPKLDYVFWLEKHNETVTKELKQLKKVAYNLFEHTDELIAYKVVRKREGKYYPMRINPYQELPFGQWLNARDYQPGGKHPVSGWWAFEQPYKEWLTKKNTVIVEIKLQYIYRVSKHDRPDYLCGQMMKIIREL